MSSIPEPQTHVFSEWMLFGNFYYQARDIIGFGFELSVENVRDAYGKGVFPWPIEGMPLPWFCPELRAVLVFEDLHISRSLEKMRKNTDFEFSIDRDFGAVLDNCRFSPRRGQHGTWITDDYARVYKEMHDLGEAHSVEVWSHGELVGGLYGVDAGGVFCGESMFFKSPNASKLALLYLIEHLRDKGSDWIDIQVLTQHMERFGAVEIPRAEFLDKLEKERERKLVLFD